MLFILAIVLICAAHYLRVRRWENFIKTYEKPDEKHLMMSLSAGYMANFFIPFKLGDLLRAILAGRKMKNGVGFSLATVIMDRYLDVFVVGVLFCVMQFTGIIDKNTETLWFYAIMTLGVLALSILIYIFRKQCKKILKGFASLFNPKIESWTLRFGWYLIWGFKDIAYRINKWKILAQTVGMWILYLASYYVFAQFATSHTSNNITWSEMFNRLFSQSSVIWGSIKNIYVNGIEAEADSVWMFLFLVISTLLLPLIALILGLFKKKEKTDEEYQNLLPHLNDKERLEFLELYFSSSKNEYINSYLKINRNVLIIRDYSAGSNATTMLCIDKNGVNFFRKYAFGADGDKLYAQVEWIERFSDILPLPEIKESDKTPEYCYYDMPYDGRTMGMFQFAHSMPVERAWGCIERVFDKLETSLYMVNKRSADEQRIEKYITDKVNKNLNIITSAKWVKTLLEYDTLNINGVDYYNLSHYSYIFDRKVLKKVFAGDDYSEIHGDLTIENIIYRPDENGADDYYIIDPNTGNIHDSSNLDYAKLLQSIHGGYEFLMAVNEVEVENNRITFLSVKSQAYNTLYARMNEYMNANFSAERVRSIYFHEIIHWLRLLPYKFEKNGKRSLLFYAGLLFVLNDVEKMFGESIKQMEKE